MAVQRGKINPWLTCTQPRPTARVRLICFPWCGGGSQIYARWGADFPPNVEVVGVCLPGRETRTKEPCATELGRTTKLLADAIFDQYSDKPYAFLGHSMGCVLCYETAVYLKERWRKPPVHIFFSSEFAPHSASRLKRLEAEFNNIGNWSDDDLIKRIAAHGGTPKDLIENKAYMVENVLPTYRGDLMLCAKYKRKTPRQKPLTCNISVIQGDQDKCYNMEEYGELTSGTMQKVTIPGGHFYLFDDSAARQLRDVITAALPTC